MTIKTDAELDASLTSDERLIEIGRLRAALATARASERERCAKVCVATWRNATNTAPDYDQNSWSHGCLKSAEAIRNLKDEPAQGEG